MIVNKGAFQVVDSGKVSRSTSTDSANATVTTVNVKLTIVRWKSHASQSSLKDVPKRQRQIESTITNQSIQVNHRIIQQQQQRQQQSIGMDHQSGGQGCGEELVGKTR
eukprot:568065-Amphidinium_carterae.4